MEENKTSLKEKFIAFWGVKRNQIITVVGGSILAAGLTLAIVLPLTLNRGAQNNNNSQSQSSSSAVPVPTGMTAAKWDAAFDNLVGPNYSAKWGTKDKISGLIEKSEMGYHSKSLSYLDNGDVNGIRDEYFEYRDGYINHYQYDKNNDSWSVGKIEESDEDYEAYRSAANIDYIFDYMAKDFCTFAGHFSDFSYDAEKGGYYAVSSTTPTFTYKGEEDAAGGNNMSNILVTFVDDKISGVSSEYFDEETNETHEYVIGSFGSTSITFPTVLL